MATTNWVLDPTHSEILFKVKYLMITIAKGEFRKFTTEIDGEDFTKAPVKVVIESSSVFTNNDDRDNQLVSDEVKIQADVQFVKQVG